MCLYFSTVHVQGFALLQVHVASQSLLYCGILKPESKGHLLAKGGGEEENRMINIYVSPLKKGSLTALPQSFIIVYIF